MGFPGSGKPLVTKFIIAPSTAWPTDDNRFADCVTGEYRVPASTGDAFVEPLDTPVDANSSTGSDVSSIISDPTDELDQDDASIFLGGFPRQR